jgi:hypothetical protein
MTLTAREWRSSADIFPMEYSDILESHKVLHGQLPEGGAAVETRNLRHQLEFEAMGKLLHLRQGALAAGWDGRRELELLEASLSPVLIVFRAVVRLTGERPPADREELVRQVAALARFEAAPFLAVVRHVRGDERVAAAAAGDVLAGYLAGVERLVSYVDQHPAGR